MIERKLIECIIVLVLVSACSMKKQSDFRYNGLSDSAKIDEKRNDFISCRFVYEDKSGIRELYLTKNIYEKLKSALLDNENYMTKEPVTLVLTPVGTFYIGDKGYVWSGHACMIPSDNENIIIKLPKCFSMSSKEYNVFMNEFENSSKIENMFRSFFSKI